MVNNNIHFSRTICLNSKGEEVDPKSRQKHINDTIGNNPDNAIDFITDTGERVTISKRMYMGMMNSIYYMDTSVSKQDFVNALNDAGGLRDGLVHPISKDELLTYMNKYDDKQTIQNPDKAFSLLHKVGVKLTKEELLEMIKKNQEDKKRGLKNLEQTPKIDTQTLLKSKKNIEPIQQPTILEQLLTK